MNLCILSCVIRENWIFLRHSIPDIFISDLTEIFERMEVSFPNPERIEEGGVIQWLIDYPMQQIGVDREEDPEKRKFDTALEEYYRVVGERLARDFQV